MADSAYLQGLAVPDSDPPRHSLIVRITHWTNTLSFAALVVSGIAILIAHPRLYWGETGSAATPSLIDLPLPLVLQNQNGWGRYLHFLAAWVCVANGALYVSSGVLTRHFRNDLPMTYGLPQRLTYLMVVFALFPLIIWTGLAMSPALTSVFPALVTLLGGHQSARTIHFFAAGALVLFLLGHVAMVVRAGFVNQVRAMITGRDDDREGKV